MNEWTDECSNFPDLNAELKNVQSYNHYFNLFLI